jgi:hypothetical protein
MHDRPTAPELLAAVREFLNREVIPACGNHWLRFRALIAANVLSVVERELVGEECRLRAEWCRLVALVGSATGNERPSTLDELRAAIETCGRALCARIRAKEADDEPWRREVLAYARWAVREKLLVSNPRFLARMESSGARKQKHDVTDCSGSDRPPLA